MTNRSKLIRIALLVLALKATHIAFTIHFGTHLGLMLVVVALIGATIAWAIDRVVLSKFGLV